MFREARFAGLFSCRACRREAAPGCVSRRANASAQPWRGRRRSVMRRASGGGMTSGRLAATRLTRRWAESLARPDPFDALLCAAFPCRRSGGGPSRSVSDPLVCARLYRGVHLRMDRHADARRGGFALAAGTVAAEPRGRRRSDRLYGVRRDHRRPARPCADLRSGLLSRPSARNPSDMEGRHGVSRRTCRRDRRHGAVRAQICDALPHRRRHLRDSDAHRPVLRPAGEFHQTGDVGPRDGCSLGDGFSAGRGRAAPSQPTI